MPRLLAAWRLGRRGRGARRGGPRPPPDRLLGDELADVARAVEKLSKGLTRDRALAGARYMDEEALLGAYLLFYWPTSYLQARGVLSELPAAVAGGRERGELMLPGPGIVGEAMKHQDERRGAVAFAQTGEAKPVRSDEYLFHTPPPTPAAP